MFIVFVYRFFLKNLVLIRTEHLVNGFIVLNTTLDGSSYDNNCFSYVTSSNNNEIDAIT